MHLKYKHEIFFKKDPSHKKCNKNRGNFVVVPAMQVHGGSEGLAPLILNFGAISRGVAILTPPHRFIPSKIPPVPTERAPELITLSEK
jgi:hypothetical protein